MDTDKTPTKLDIVMALLDVSASGLSLLCGVSNSLISRWQSGIRPLTARSEALRPLADALLTLDADGLLDERLAPFRVNGESKTEALCLYLTDEPLPALPNRAAPPRLQRSGSYVAEQQVLLGASGFRKGALLMLDYINRLPPGQRVIVCAHGGFDLWHLNLPFALQFILKMNEAVKRGTTFTLVNRNAPGMDGSPWFSVFWITAHLKGTIRSRYYEGEPPEEYFVGVIPGYWSGRMEADADAEDGLLAALTTDPRQIRRDEAHCAAYLEKSVPASRYGFLREPLGLDISPDGGFSAICRTPSFGIMTKEEFARIPGADHSPATADGLFRGDASFAPAPHRIILCREDVREGLLYEQRRSEPLSQLLRRDAFVPRETLAAQIERLLAAMRENKDFEVALMPRSAFDKLEIELVCWRGGVSLSWLQNGGESIFDDNPLVSLSFFSAADHTWSRLHQGWKNRRSVSVALRNWLAGIGLDKVEKDSSIVRNWDVLPKE